MINLNPIRAAGTRGIQTAPVSFGAAGHIELPGGK
jgi:hypothetical protein